jgi:hypothetical protein
VIEVERVPFIADHRAIERRIIPPF